MSSTVPTFARRALPRAALLLVLVAALVAIPATRAPASGSQQSWFDDNVQVLANPAGTLQRLRLLGVQQIRLMVAWADIAPNPNSLRRPRGFNASNPAAYPARNWAAYDAVMRTAQQDGIGVALDAMGGAPLWATGSGDPVGPSHGWEPSPSEYGAFVRALGTRYSGTYKPKGATSALPRVSIWSVWNEPDYAASLTPQGLHGVEYAPRVYRGLLNAAWGALHATGHGKDTILWGELAPRGGPYGPLSKGGYGSYWGGMTPLAFLRALYCVDSSYRELRGSAASLRGCPTSAAGSRRFRAQNPALFEASGVSDHPYMRWYAPNHEINPDPTDGMSTGNYATLGVIGQLERALNRLTGVYGSSKRFSIYDTEFSYQTDPPKHDNQVESNGQRYPWVSPATAAYYINWAEYISWRDPRIQSYMQYLLYDPEPALRSNDWGGYAAGLMTYRSHVPKADYYAYRLPLYLPVTSSRRGRSLEVWGCVRPAHFAILDTGQPQSAQIQFAPGSSQSFTTVQTVTISHSSNCYFDVHVKFPASGTVRLTYTFPANDPKLAESYVTYSRHVQITLR